ncbi:MAG: MFS transporter [Planctomycetota bacterium]|jgi:MFS family permease
MAGADVEEKTEEPPDTGPAPTPANFPGLIPSVWRKHIYTGAMGATHFTLLTGMILVAYIRELGVSYRGLGMLVGLSSFAFSFQLLGAHVVARIGRRRTFWFYAAMAERLFRGLAVLAVFYLARVDVTLASVVFVGFMTLASMFTALSLPCWFSWLTDLIPAERHGRMWGVRSVWTGLTVICIALPGAWFIDRMTEAGMGVHGMLVVFALGLAVGYVDLFIHRTIPEPHMKAEPGRKLWSEVVKVLRDARFRPVLMFKAAWGFSMALGGAVTLVYLNEYLGFRHNLFMGVLALIAIPTVSGVLAAPYIGGLVDRLGCRRVLVWAHVAWSTIPLGLILMRPGAHVAWAVAGLFFVTNIAMRAAMNASQKLTTRLPKREDRGMYLAVSTCVGSLAVGAGALVAGEVMQLLDGWSVTVFGVGFVGFHVLFGASALLRLASTALTARLPDRQTEHATMRESECRRAA